MKNLKQSSFNSLVILMGLQVRKLNEQVMETNTVLTNLPSFSRLSNGDRPTQTVGSPSEFENLIVIPSVVIPLA